MPANLIEETLKVWRYKNIHRGAWCFKKLAVFIVNTAFKKVRQNLIYVWGADKGLNRQSHTVSVISGKDIPEIPILDTGLFGGAVLTNGEDYNKLNFAAKFIIKSMKKSVDEKLNGNDFRDWEKIKAWANEIAHKLK